MGNHDLNDPGSASDELALALGEHDIGRLTVNGSAQSTPRNILVGRSWASFGAGACMTASSMAKTILVMAFSDPEGGRGEPAGG